MDTNDHCHCPALPYAHAHRYRKRHRNRAPHRYAITKPLACSHSDTNPHPDDQPLLGPGTGGADLSYTDSNAG